MKNADMLREMLSPEERAEHDADYEKLRSVVDQQRLTQTKLTNKTLQEQTQAIRELAAAVRAPRTRVGTIETEDGPVRLTVTET